MAEGSNSTNYTGSYRESMLNDQIQIDAPKRILSAPTLYCVFAMGTILVLIGTFITAHIYISKHGVEDDSQVNIILRYVGPIILGFGGALLFGMSIVCLFAYNKSKGVCTVNSEELFSVGASTFYGNQQLLNQRSSKRHRPQGIENRGGPINENDPLKFLAETVVNERMRKLSKSAAAFNQIQLSDTDSLNFQRKYLGIDDKQGFPHSLQNLNDPNVQEYLLQNRHAFPANSSEFIHMEGLKRIPPCESLSHISEVVDDSQLKALPRDRSFSMIGTRPNLMIDQNAEVLRRNLSLSQSARQTHREEQKRRRERRDRKSAQKKEKTEYPEELQYQYDESSPFYSMKKQIKSKMENMKEAPEIHYLPSPDIISSILELANKQNFNGSMAIELAELQTPSTSATEQTYHLSLQKHDKTPHPFPHVAKLKDINDSTNTFGTWAAYENKSNESPKIFDTTSNETSLTNIHNLSEDLAKDEKVLVTPNRERKYSKLKMGVSTLTKGSELPLIENNYSETNYTGSHLTASTENISSSDSFKSDSLKTPQIHHKKNNSKKLKMDVDDKNKSDENRELEQNQQNRKSLNRSLRFKSKLTGGAFKIGGTPPPSPSSSISSISSHHSNSSLSSSPPPSWQASTTAVSIMAELCQTPSVGSMLDRSNKVLSIISSNDEEGDRGNDNDKGWHSETNLKPSNANNAENNKIT